MGAPDLLLFAKQPRAGEVKTRLQPHYSPEAAAEIAGFLVRATVELAVSVWPGAVYLYAWPSARHPLFAELAAVLPVRLADQVAGDLGKKMCTALTDGVARAGSAAVMGCDVPHCRPDVLMHAYARLSAGYDVIGPTIDGGYYLLGVHAAYAGLFEDVDWRSDAVFAQTVSSARRAGLDLEVLSMLRDIDTPADLQHVAQGYPALRRFLEDL